MILYELPKELRDTVSRIHTYLGAEILEGEREFVGLKLKASMYLKLAQIYVVGDVVCTTLVQYVGIPRLCIVDYKTLRSYISNSSVELAGLFDRRIRCTNPPGHVSYDCMNAIREALDNFAHSLIEVDGEEDLLGFPVILYAPSGFMLYGIPRRGVAILDVESVRTFVLNIFSKFRVKEI